MHSLLHTDASNIQVVPWTRERCGPAIDLALNRINKDFLDHHKVFLNKIEAR